MLDGLSEVLNVLLTVFIISIIVAVFGLCYFCYSFFFKDYNTIKTREHPTVTWELKANSQNVDTVWIYKFKK